MVAQPLNSNRLNSQTMAARRDCSRRMSRASETCPEAVMKAAL
jgi:hypothetical protein